MAGQFTGWPEQAFDVLLHLDGDPPASVRERHRKDREHLIRRPMVALMEAVAARDETYADFSVWRYGKTVWWWQHQCGIVRIDRSVEIGLRFDLDGLHVQGSWWYAARDQIERYRAAVADGSAGPELPEILTALQAKGFELGGDVMKRVPRAYAADHPRADLLRHRSLTAALPMGCDEWLHTPEVVDRLLAAYEELRPLLSWLSDHASAGYSPTPT